MVGIGALSGACMLAGAVLWWVSGENADSPVHRAGQAFTGADTWLCSAHQFSVWPPILVFVGATAGFLALLAMPIARAGRAFQRAIAVWPLAAIAAAAYAITAFPVPRRAPAGPGSAVKLIVFAPEHDIRWPLLALGLQLLILLVPFVATGYRQFRHGAVALAARTGVASTVGLAAAGALIWASLARMHWVGL